MNHNAAPQKDPADSSLDAGGLSRLSCVTCRRRKAKCDRKLPSCDVCATFLQTCTYPAGRLRPGPKTGSKQKKPRVYRRPTKAASQPDNHHHRHDARPSDPGRSSTSTASYQVDNSMAEADPFRHLEIPLSPETTVATTSVVQPALSEPPLASSSLYDPLFLPYSDHKTDVVQDDVLIDSLLFDQVIDHTDALLATCHALNISPRTLHQLIDTYFANMTAFSLFHQPTFMEKLQTIGPSLYLNALLASMFSFSARFEIPASAAINGQSADEQPSDMPSPEEFHQLALRFEEEALTFCRDEVPPLCFLQSITLTTFYEMTKSVRGRAWRWLGTCVRVSYELDLHLIDADAADGYTPTKAEELDFWVLDEERRRIWWAVWEIDNYASNLRRLPAGINNVHNKTWLPVDDVHWFKKEFRTSSYLGLRPAERWKILQASSNGAASAWFIVVNSLLRDAQEIASLRGPMGGFSSHSAPYARQAQSSSAKRNVNANANDELTMLAHSLQCTLLALPAPLQYHNEYLNFASFDPAEAPRARRLHCAKYSIYVLAEVTRFIISHYHAFGGEECHTLLGSGSRPGKGHGWNPAVGLMCSSKIPDSEALAQYVEAADNITMLLNRCSTDHVRYVNPFLAHSIWLAAAAQLLQKKFGANSHNRDGVNARLDILRLTYTQFITFWDIHDVLLQTLDTLEKHTNGLAAETHPGHEHENARARGLGSDSNNFMSAGRHSYSGAGTEPNLTGSGQNPALHSLKKYNDRRTFHTPYNSMPSAASFPSSSTTAMSSGMDKNLPYASVLEDCSTINGEPPSDQGLNSMELCLDLDLADECLLPLSLVNMLPGSYAQGRGPMG